MPQEADGFPATLPEAYEFPTMLLETHGFPTMFRVLMGALLHLGASGAPELCWDGLNRSLDGHQ